MIGKINIIKIQHFNASNRTSSTFVLFKDIIVIRFFDYVIDQNIYVFVRAFSLFDFFIYIIDINICLNKKSMPKIKYNKI